MQIIRDKNFIASRDAILEYIARDSIDRAIEFDHTLNERISNIAYMAYKYRQSIYYDSEDIRDYIFKGYVIPYLIDEANNQILLLDMIKWIDK